MHTGGRTIGPMWEPPSETTAALFREGIERLLASGGEGFFERIDEASLSQHSPEVGEDPALLTSFRRANRSLIMHWVVANLEAPGAEVTPFTGPELQELVRDLVRRGLDVQALEPFRSGQNAAWEAWMTLAFELTDDASELRELLDLSARSIFAYVEATMASTVELITRERAELALGTSAERLEALTLVLDGKPIDLERAERRLGYALEQPHPHLAAILWSEDGTAGDAQLRKVADGLAAACGAPRALNITATGSSLWSWIPARHDPEPEEIDRALSDDESVRIALGSPGPGTDGFRRSHEQAYATQRLVGRLESPLRFARYEELRLVGLVSRDEDEAQRFVDEVLGDLADASDVLRQTLRTYLRLQSNASRAAEALFAHRNTVIARIAKAEELLPRPLADSALEVGVALELIQVSGGG